MAVRGAVTSGVTTVTRSGCRIAAMRYCKLISGGSTGYGKQYVNAGDHQWAGTMHTDLIDGKTGSQEKASRIRQRSASWEAATEDYATLAG